MKFSEMIKTNEKVLDFYKRYMYHPFIKEIKRGTLSKERFYKYLVQDSLYLKGYAKVYAHVFLLCEDTEDLQFLHSCIGVIVADETNMHKQYLNQHGLTFKEIDGMTIEKENQDYLSYMLDFASSQDIKKLFVSALPCTLTYEYIGQQVLKDPDTKLEDSIYRPWIETYAGDSFKQFSKKSCELIDRLCQGLEMEELEELIDIYLEACQHELNFWDMSYRLEEGISHE